MWLYSDSIVMMLPVLDDQLCVGSGALYNKPTSFPCCVVKGDHYWGSFVLLYFMLFAFPGLCLVQFVFLTWLVHQPT